MRKLIDRLSNIPTIYYFVLLIAINVLFLTIAGLLYNGKFLFWEYPLSFLGMKYTFAEKAINTYSMYFYGASMFLSGITMLALALRNRIKHLKNDSLRSLLYLLAGSGLFIAAFSPNDTSHSFHVLGSALFISIMWILATSKLHEIREQLGIARYWLMQSFLQIPIFIYAFAYFCSIDPLGSIMQIITLFSIGLTTILIHAITKINKISD